MLSIRHFLWASLLPAMTCVIIAAAAFTYFDVTKKINGIFDAQLIEAAHVLKHTVEQSTLQQIAQLDHLHELDQLFSPNQNYLPPKLWDTIYGDSLHRYDTRRVFQIWSEAGVLLVRTEGAPSFPLAKNVAGFSNSDMGQYTWRVYTLIDEAHHVRYQVAQRDDVRLRLVRHIALGNILPDLLILPISLFIIWLCIRIAFKNVRKTVDEVKNRALDHLEPINTASTPVEIRPLIDEINLLLARLQEAYAREKRFTADAAHELRTPLAALKTQAEVAQQARDPAAYQTTLEKIIHCVDRCARVVTQLLTLSNLRPDQPLADVVSADISRLAVDIVAELAVEALRKKIDISFEPAASVAMVEGNATLLQVLMRNLIDNAIRYTPSGGAVIVRTGFDDGQVFFCVEDSGPGVPVELHSRIFDRFYRQLGNTASGSGLGLSIVQQIVELHGARIEVGAASGHSGLKVTVYFGL